ncbi:hypothetical protein LTR10_023071 [Elasticomyces elasticus]|nr:hypothetical protein LTR10_023071 [Elasticomyces elasticus]
MAEVHRFNSVTQFVVAIKSLLFNPAGDDKIPDTQKQGIYNALINYEWTLTPEQTIIIPKFISQGSLFSILKSSNVVEIQSQGRNIPGFDKQIWSRAAPIIAGHAIAAKAELNPDMTKELLANHQCDWRAAGGPGNGAVWCGIRKWHQALPSPYRTDIAVIKLDHKTIEAMELAEVSADHARNIHAEIRPLKENKVYKLTIQYEKERVVTQNILVSMPHVFFQDLKSTLAAGQSWCCFIIEATPGHVKKQFDALDQKRKVHAAADPMKRW